MSDAIDYRRRIVDDVLDERLASDPAILITGPRGCGKTTTASRRVASVVRLDVPGEAEAFRSDPDAAIGRVAGPVLLDEWQQVPEVLAAVRRAVDAGAGPGQYLLTGSMRANRGPSLWPGTGRIARVRMEGLTQSEQRDPDGSNDVMARLLHPSDSLGRSRSKLPDYLDLAVRGGMPAVVLRGRSPLRWYADYLDQFIDRDVPETGTIAEPDRLRRYLVTLAESTAGTPTTSTLLQAARINAKTAARYDVILTEMGILEVAPTWSRNRLSRIVKQGKVYLTDTGLTAAALEVDADDLLADGGLYGRITDAFVAAQIRPALAVGSIARRLYHLRDQGGRHEIDLILDLGRRGIVAIEIKAAASVTPQDARHLAWLRDQLGDQFASGLVLHTGPDGYELGDRIVAAPISFLWS
ncbi:ATP-binding protein [Microlunatus elymi]|uniref:ATP-binding protein n=1 Tax=Microlunatus elymi TaxID=2596828 RepID=UPI001AF0244F|nr:ATP-binding protein [Microlunatus elymi]